MAKENSHHPKVVFTEVNQLTLDKATPAVLSSLRSFLNDAASSKYTLRQYYIDREKKAREIRDGIKTKLNQTEEQRAAFIKLQEDYENESLNNMVKNENDLGDKCLEKDGKLIQRTNPIFLDPDNNYGRAHFYAPQKKLFGKYYSTFWFNLCVIWGMSIFMMITLYFDALKKLLDAFGKIGSLFSKKH
jgi:ABC transport system ATP-binding/permease protein